MCTCACACACASACASACACGGSADHAGARGCGGWASIGQRTVVVAHSVDDPRAEVVHVEYDALSHGAVVRAWRAVETALMTEPVASRELWVARDAVMPRLRHRTRVGQDAVEVRGEQQEEQQVEDRLVMTRRRLVETRQPGE